MTVFDAWLIFIAIFSGATASVVGFGIGSLLTPLLASRFGIEVAVAAVTIPHAVATALRCWRLRANIDRQVLFRFGLVSAAGGLLGAFFYTQLSVPGLERALGGLLILTAIAQLTGFARRWHPRGVTVTLLGLLSGFFGGVVGNQGGLRAAALTSFGLSPAVFIATATATGLLVDIARFPIYTFNAGTELFRLWQPIALATGGVVAGTLVGERILFGLSPTRFGQLVGLAVGLLGIWFLLSAS